MQGMLYRQKLLVPCPLPAESCTEFIPDRVTFSWLTLAHVPKAHFPIQSLYNLGVFFGTTAMRETNLLLSARL